MANLYKKPVLLKNPKTGEKVKTKSKKWWGQYKDATGRLRRQPLAIDKAAAQAMLNEIVRNVEREKAGLIDPTDAQRKRTVAEHLAEFESYLANKGVTPKQVYTVISQLRKIATACQWNMISNMNSSSLLEFLGNLRRQGRSAQTYNHYLKAAKQFASWLVRDQRTPFNVLAHLAKLNVATDRRHDRRALSVDELRRLLEAAREGKRIEGISGPDRAVMYAFAAWTGFRKGEIGSLTRLSLQLDNAPPTATVDACFSKRRRLDKQVLHPDLARLLKAWLAEKHRLTPTEPLFPISGRVRGGIERKTHLMMKRDLAAARRRWLDEAESDSERESRERSDFLLYRNHAGLYADFHSCRHLFITSLERAGVRPKVAQSLARHSDIRLTLGVYAHSELTEQTAAIAALPAPPVQ